MVLDFSLEEITINPEESLLISEFHGERDAFYFVKPKDLLLPDFSNYSFSMVAVDQGFEITIKSSQLLKDVFLSSNTKGKFLDNFFDLLPNEEKTILFHTNDKKKPEIMVRTLNDVIEIDNVKKESYKTDSK